MQIFDTPQQAVQWLRARITGQLRTDSRLIVKGDGFLAWPGYRADARNFVAQAFEQGAAACLLEHQADQALAQPNESMAQYRSLKVDAGLIAAEWLGNPSAQMAVFAVTGTNGKTSIAWWLAQAWSGCASERTTATFGAVVGTLGAGVLPSPTASDTALPLACEQSGLTTPDAVFLQTQFRRFVDAGVTACAIEASSIGLQEHRLAGSQIRVAVFTNLTQDHLDYHGTMAAYWQAKKRLFDWPTLGAAVINIDDMHGAELAQNLALERNRVLDIWSYSLSQTDARLYAGNIAYNATGLCFTVHENTTGQAPTSHSLQTRLMGRYNVANILAVIGALRAVGVSLPAALHVCATLLPVPGRMECMVEQNQPWVAVDYAHTPDALAQALRALQPLAQARGGRLYCVFGCGGNRDAGKRPLMAAVAQAEAEVVFMTTDNPRFEDPAAILAQMEQGLKPNSATAVHTVLERAQAIQMALAQARAADVVLIAGKGHETYQEIAGVKWPFSDQAIARAALQQRSSKVSEVSL